MHAHVSPFKRRYKTWPSHCPSALTCSNEVWNMYREISLLFSTHACTYTYACTHAHTHTHTHTNTHTNTHTHAHTHAHAHTKEWARKREAAWYKYVIILHLWSVASFSFLCRRRRLLWELRPKGLPPIHQQLLQCTSIYHLDHLWAYGSSQPWQ